MRRTRGKLRVLLFLLLVVYNLEYIIVRINTKATHSSCHTLSTSSHAYHNSAVRSLRPPQYPILFLFTQQPSSIPYSVQSQLFQVPALANSLVHFSTHPSSRTP